MIPHLLALLLPLAVQDKPTAPPPTPLAAVQKMQTALQQHDLKALAEVAAQPHAGTLQTLAEPFSKARKASDRFDKAVRDKLKFPFVHPFAASLSPFADRQLELVEIAKDGTQLLARVRYGTPGSALEETLGIHPIDSIYRIDLPAEITRMTQKLARPAPLAAEGQGATTPLAREKQRLEGVALILDTVAEEIEKGKWTTKETVTLRLLELVQESKLADGLNE
jgi:hypothetical protein